jgi:hypothetical protein
MGTETIFEILEERGRIVQSWRDILRVLTRRSGALSPEIPPMIERLDKLDVLDSLHDEALIAPTLEDFLRRIPPAEA